MVSWRSKEQSVVIWSSVEGEFGALNQGICELLWLILVLRDLKEAVTEPIMLYFDNKTTIKVAYNLVQRYRTKHMEVDHLFEVGYWSNVYTLCLIHQWLMYSRNVY